MPKNVLTLKIEIEAYDLLKGDAAVSWIHYPQERRSFMSKIAEAIENLCDGHSLRITRACTDCAARTDHS